MVYATKKYQLVLSEPRDASTKECVDTKFICEFKSHSLVWNKKNDENDDINGKTPTNLVNDVYLSCIPSVPTELTAKEYAETPTIQLLRTIGSKRSLLSFGLLIAREHKLAAKENLDNQLDLSSIERQDLGQKLH